MTLPTGPVCTEHDIWRLAWRDYEDMVPAYQVLAAGSDGVILPSDRWTLHSASSDFVAQQVGVGRFVKVVNLPDPVRHNTPMKDGDIFQVDGVTTDTLTLRRPELATGAGMPPGVAGTETDGLQFLIGYIDPQIDEASREINTQVYSDTSLDPTDPEWRRQYGIWAVLYMLYFAAWDQVTNDLNYAKMRSAEKNRDRIADLLYARSQGEGAFAVAPMNHRSMLGWPAQFGPDTSITTVITGRELCDWSWPVGFGGFP